MKRLLLYLTLGLLSTNLAGCRTSTILPLVLLSPFVGVEKSSPTQTAAGVRVGVPLAESEAGTLLGLGGVQFQSFDGGHDVVYTIGLQGRRQLNESGTWVGAEGTYNNWRVSDGFQDPAANVFGLGGLAGRPIGDSGVSVWGSASVLFFSDFTKDGSPVYEGGTGYQLNVGVELGVGGS
ncbi:MAG: hypothetical protein ACI9OJ_005908 [Myxococcota bacterium]|jgi:hypothetical protein